MLENRDKSEILSNPENHTLIDKIYGFLNGLHFPDIESWRVRRDFQYMKEAGWYNLRMALEQFPRFDSADDNKTYLGFLVGKL